MVSSFCKYLHISSVVTTPVNFVCAEDMIKCNERDIIKYPFTIKLQQESI